MITHQKGKEVRTYLDKNGKRITNDRAVYKEVFTGTKKGNYSKLEFFDANDQPMESNWEISEYLWFKKSKMVIEKRYNLKKEAKNLSTYFDFGITGMTVRKDGTPKETMI
jgi:hypothetical protein